ncbi:hypothetical protein [Burkholderia sp. Cy-637]|uniref:hypothetical protein n=1 Tax=Burkholderia sp. Cy-637 TaxID=2608327 RepID=UPI00141FD42C|nr:hypothetical protein [Burkholderia sp. Cy-637]NIF91695.1 hypothetical protein [Burkholderia sp. Cy-637]
MLEILGQQVRAAGIGDGRQWPGLSLPNPRVNRSPLNSRRFVRFSIRLVLSTLREVDAEYLGRLVCSKSYFGKIRRSFLIISRLFN